MFSNNIVSIKKRIIISISIILSFFLGYFLNSVIGSEGSGVSKDSGFKAGWDAARQRFVETGFYFPADETSEIKNIYGNVTAVGGNKITLKIKPLDPLADPDLDVRIVDVSEAKIYSLTEKNHEEYQKEMEEFQAKMELSMDASMDASVPAFNEAVMPPEIFYEKEISLKDIKEGENIRVEAGENIRDKKEFKAIKIVKDHNPGSIAAPIVPENPLIQEVF